MVRNAYKPQTVNEAKQQLRIATAKIDYFGMVRRHPIESAGIAILAGIMVGRLKKGSLPPGLLGLGVQLLKHL